MRKIDLAAIKSRLSEPRPGERKKQPKKTDEATKKERSEQPAMNRAPAKPSKYVAPRAEPAKPALLSLEDV